MSDDDQQFFYDAWELWATQVPYYAPDVKVGSTRTLSFARRLQPRFSMTAAMPILRAGVTAVLAHNLTFGLRASAGLRTNIAGALAPQARLSASASVVHP